MALLQISEPGQSPDPHQFKRGAGIDLGTTHSLVAAVDTRHGKSNSGAKVIADEDGQGITPSVVYYAKDGLVHVGKAAQQRAIEDPHNTLASFKRWLGRSVDELGLQNRYQLNRPLSEAGVVTVDTVAGPVNAIQASAQILATLSARAESYLGGALEGVVITVPAYFDESQRQSTKDAARLAGLNVLRLISEPTAAAVAYGLGKADDRFIAVYDLGGGTFDISLLQLSKGVFEVVATGGNSELGGDDLDRVIATWVAEQGGFEFAELSAQGYSQLIESAKQAKHQLSEQRVASIEFESGEQQWRGDLSRETFEQLVQPFIDKTLSACKSCVNDAGIHFNEIADVVMVGGSTRVPAVRNAVEALFQQPVKADVDPDQVVAIGAAIQADVLLGNERQDDLLLLDVTPLSLGLEMYGGLVEKIVPRNTPIPVTRAQEFTTAKDGQTALSLHVVQGERERVEDCRSLARFQLSGIPPMVAGAAKIQVTFSVDADGLLEVHARETETGVDANIKVEPAHGLNEDQITEMLHASFEFAEKDKQSRMLVEQQVESKSLIESVSSALQSDGDLLAEHERQPIEALIAKLRLLVENGDADSLRATNAELGRATEEFAARRMDKSIKLALQGKSVDQFDES